jgi:PKD repeat protein
MGGGDMEYMNVTGASLNALLNESNPLNGAVSVIFTGSDGFSSNPVSLSSIQEDNGSIIAFNSPPDGSLRDIIPSEGMPMNWAFDLVSITVLGPAPVANFTANVTSGVTPLTVQFNDTSSFYPTSWSWNFGDGTFSTQQNPVHTYTAIGSHTVCLTATNAGGNSNALKMYYIVVSAPPA